MPDKSSHHSASKKPWPQYRSKHRQQSHELAHAEGPTSSADFGSPLFEHPLVCRDAPTLISDSDSLADLLQHLRQVGNFGYDSEFIGEQTYYPQLCLIQVATPVRIALIDPLAGVDLTSFWELLADPAVEKVVHAGMPDLEPVARHLNCPPQAIFDTQIAAGFAGLTYPMALGKLLELLASQDLMGSSRSVKFSQWDRRPLTAAQLHYAANDVRYLPMIRQLLCERISSHNNWNRVAAEFESLADISLYLFDPHSQRVKARGVEKLSQRKKAVLRALVAWRDTAAREQNVPTRSLLRDDVLFSLASEPVMTMADLKKVAGLPRPVERLYSQAIIQATAKALATPLDHQGREGESHDSVPLPDGALAPPLSAPPPDRSAHRQQIDRLWTEIEALCTAHHITPTVVTSKRELDELLFSIARRRPIPNCRILGGWRRDFLKDVLAAIVPTS